jgi:uncharacterized protein (DUF1778 family)
MARSSSIRIVERPARGSRLGFRVDARTKKLVERAARLEHRSLTDYCMTALAEAARQSLERHSALFLSKADRAAFFDAPVSPPRPSARLRRALRIERSRVAP